MFFNEIFRIACWHILEKIQTFKFKGGIGAIWKITFFPPDSLSSHQLVVTSSSLIVLSLDCPLIPSSSWLVDVLPLLAPPSCCLSCWPHLPHHCLAVVHHRRHQTPSNAAATIERHHHRHHWMSSLLSTAVTAAVHYQYQCQIPTPRFVHCRRQILMPAPSSLHHRPSVPPTTVALEHCHRHWTLASSSTATTAVAATGVVDPLTIVHWWRKRQQHHHHQRTNVSIIVKTFTSLDNLSLFKLIFDTVFEVSNVCWGI